MEFMIKICKALLDIWNIIKNIISLFRKKEDEKQQIQDNEKTKEEIEENIKDENIIDLNKDAGWKK